MKLTKEEMKKQLEEAQQRVNELRESLNKVEQEEEDRRKAELALAQETRKKEVDEAFENYQKLLNNYIKDYDSYHKISDADLCFPNAFWRSFF